MTSSSSPSGDDDGSDHPAGGEPHEARIAAEIRRLFTAVYTTPSAQIAFLTRLVSRLGFAARIFPRSTGLPDQAPALWLERKDRGQSPPEFIRRHYAPWLGRLTQADIRRLDRSLYMALHKWLRTNAMPDDLDLPTRKEMNDRLLAAREEDAGRPPRPYPTLPEDREAQRLHEAARRRARKRRTPDDP